VTAIESEALEGTARREPAERVTSAPRNGLLTFISLIRIALQPTCALKIQVSQTAGWRCAGRIKHD